mmetsp:Transcript_16263/g.54696  ORF Transcript_16263/g.54696 Transcript_16263/m.54696 type:complete len:371 (+) Transcript_16263:80-1192(+)
MARASRRERLACSARRTDVRPASADGPIPVGSQVLLRPPPPLPGRPAGRRPVCSISARPSPTTAPPDCEVPTERQAPEPSPRPASLSPGMKLLASLLLALAATAEGYAGVARSVRPAVVSSRSKVAMGLGGRGFGGGIGRAGRKFWPAVRRGSTGSGSDGTGSGSGSGTPPPSSSGSSSSDDSKPSGPLGSIWAGYMGMLETQPLLTKALTSLTGFAIGDILVQLFIEKKETFDWVRFVRFSSFGALIHGPTGHWFYGNLDSLIPGATARKVFTKVFIDQVLWNPIFGIMFFGYMAATEGKGPMLVVKRIQNDLLTQVTGSWKVWPVAHAINFAFVPTSQRLLYINTIQIAYNMFLSVIGNRGAEDEGTA